MTKIISIANVKGGTGKTIIYNSIKYKESSALHITIQEHSPEHSKVFQNLVKEVLQKL